MAIDQIQTRVARLIVRDLVLVKYTYTHERENTLSLKARRSLTNTTAPLLLPVNILADDSAGRNGS